MDVLVVLVVVALIIAAIGTYVIIAAREAREPQHVPAHVKMSPLSFKPLDVRTRPTARTAAEATAISIEPGTHSAPGGVTLDEERLVTPLRPTRPPTPAEPAAASSPVVPPPAAPSELFDLEQESPPVAPAGEITWFRQFDTRSATLDDVARLRLIGDLGVIAREWCVPLLAQAYLEEVKTGHRQAALNSLVECRSRAAAATFKLALNSTEAAEREIASDALADLEPPPSGPKTPRSVERH